MMELAGRSVVLTGVGREGQMGEALGQAFAARGARVFLVGHDDAAVRARAEAIVAAGGRAASLAADLTNAEAVRALAERIREATAGKVQALVHAAGGYAPSGPVADSDPAVWSAQFAMNATSAYLVARAFLPLLRPVKGAFVFFASDTVLPGGRRKGNSAYVAAKSALVGLMETIAQEEAASGVRANAVAPGTIRTAKNLAAVGSDTPMVTREAVAEVVLWLASESSRAVTGQVVPVR
jgi:NAD(P)-dependent dehydrogenase (short-subunit alcohol dehydrogenase family)